ncbi:spore germination protein [Paenibacillus sp. MWE-103]|uniref:Spore germination protein n=1 Tax=Paenibacillus artemisiicola TaxID=1172618 RepID=A0ABS3WEL6_9BACL|nr:spore germination protein [Paenibacillus artemisiicola]MBO7746744.1 spore germination protein [Paenibacillus artemisiicola]
MMFNNDIFKQALKSNDFLQFRPNDDRPIQISYYLCMVDGEKINQFLLPGIKENIENLTQLSDIKGIIPFEDVTVVDDTEEVLKKLMKGYVIIQFEGDELNYLMVNANHADLGHRKSNETENEFSVVGPKIGFVENIEVNMHLMRQQINTPALIFEKITVGSLSNTKVVIAYLDGITNPRHVETMRQRLQAIDFDVVFDNSQLTQIITDHSNTPFPLFVTTERVDRVIFSMLSGQVAVFSDGSPYAITAPSSLLDFFISGEDYYLSWILASFFRVIRIMSVIFSIIASPLYVSVLTYHFEVIPESLLQPLIDSRIHVPFPPVIEVIFLEITIELLREAGARLPAKIGQTLGIVGGIVIGEASVQAAFTSNILLIIVALSALASFTTPIYNMANTIRLLRFPFILLAAFWGGFGLTVGFLLLLGHLLRLKSLGTPYLVPLFPFRKGHFADSFVRLSYKYTANRSDYLKPLSKKRYTPDKESIDND